MKNLLLIIGIGLMLGSCLSKEEKIKNQLRENFKKEYLINFIDPTSFEEISIRIIDTMFVQQLIRQELELNSMDSSFYYDDEIKYNLFKLKKDSLNKLYKTIPKDSIHNINFEYKYKAKNGFNSYLINNQIIPYNLKTNKFDFEFQEKIEKLYDK